MNDEFNNLNQNNNNGMNNNPIDSTNNNISNSVDNSYNSVIQENNNSQFNTQPIYNGDTSSITTNNEISKNKGSKSKVLVAIIIILLIGGITFGVLFATGFFDKSKSNKDSKPNSDIDNNSSNNNKSNKDVDLSGSYKIPLEDIYFSVPNWHEVELTGYTEQFSKYGKSYVTITGNRNLKANSSKEAYEVCSKLFLKALGSTSAKEFKIEKEENVKINGIDMYKFEGKLYHYTSGLDRYTIGYAFTINDIAIQITGVVVDEEQPEELITEMKNIVNEMAKHARTTE